MALFYPAGSVIIMNVVVHTCATCQHLCEKVSSVTQLHVETLVLFLYICLDLISLHSDNDPLSWRRSSCSNIWKLRQTPPLIPMGCTHEVT